MGKATTMAEVSGSELRIRLIQLNELLRAEGKPTLQQKDIAAIIGVTTGAISNALNGNRYQQLLRNRIADYLESKTRQTGVKAWKQ